MKSILKNFLSIFRRFRLAMILNILGLSVAFSAFMLIIMQLEYDLNFNRTLPNADHIYRVNKSIYSDGNSLCAIVSRPTEEIFSKSSSHIEAGVLLHCLLEDFTFSTEIRGERHSYTETVQKTTSGLTDVFRFDMAEGNAHALQEPSQVLQPLSMAKKIFGSEPATGKILKSEEETFTVGGVYKDFPRNSSISNIVYKKMADDYYANEWTSAMCIYYIRLDDPANASGIVDNFKRLFNPRPAFGFDTWEEVGEGFSLTPFTELHYVTGIDFDFVPKTSKETLLLLFCIALVVLIVAGINYTNFSMAMAPVRIKTINTHKVLGAGEGNIRFSLLSEAIGIAFISFLLSLLLVKLFGYMPISGVVDADISLNERLLFITAIIAFITGIIAGIYPAYYMTSFTPALVLKGSFGLSAQGRRLRNGLIAVQFTSAFVLIIGAAFMYLQNRYMMQSSLGYDKDLLIVSKISPSIIDNYQITENEMKSFAGVEAISYAFYLLSNPEDIYPNSGNEYNGQLIRYRVIAVYPSFLKTIGVALNEGRDFLEGDMESHCRFIFNELARAKYNLEVEGIIGQLGPVIGFIPDIKFASFRQQMEPMAFMLLTKESDWEDDLKPNYIYVRVTAGTNMIAAKRHIENSLRKIDTEYAFNVRFYDDVLNATYEKERKLNSLITLFSLIAVFLSIMGVFGMVVFESEFRRREIGIRKVFGSTVGEILLLFNKTYVRILCICFVLAAPVAWYAVDKWLENFAYKTPVYWWVYLLAFAAVLIVTVCTVTFQNWRAANTNPIDTIKSE